MKQHNTISETFLEDHGVDIEKM